MRVSRLACLFLDPHWESSKSNFRTINLQIRTKITGANSLSVISLIVNEAVHRLACHTGIFWVRERTFSY